MISSSCFVFSKPLPRLKETEKMSTLASLSSEFRTIIIDLHLFCALASKPAEYAENIGTGRRNHNKRGPRELNCKYYWEKLIIWSWCLTCEMTVNRCVDWCSGGVCGQSWGVLCQKRGTQGHSRDAQSKKSARQTHAGQPFSDDSGHESERSVPWRRASCFQTCDGHVLRYQLHGQARRRRIL